LKARRDDHIAVDQNKLKDGGREETFGRGSLLKESYCSVDEEGAGRRQWRKMSTREMGGRTTLKSDRASPAEEAIRSTIYSNVRKGRAVSFS
jgi:hypothetical protein